MLRSYTSFISMFAILFFWSACDNNSNPASSVPDSFTDIKSSAKAASTGVSAVEYELTVPLSDPSGLIGGIEINNQNQMLFRGFTQQFNGRDFVYHPDDGLTEILSSDPDDRITTVSINELGQVVGSYFNSNVGTRSFTWSPDIGFVSIPTPGYSSNALEINDHGEVVGIFRTGVPGQSMTNVYRWNSTDGFVDISDRTQFSSTSGLNNKGVLAGNNNPQLRSGIYELDGNETFIPFPSTVTRSFAMGINESGTVPGWYEENGSNLPFIWNEGSPVQTLSTTSTRNSALGINNLGEVVGTDGINGPLPLYWDTNGQVHSLPLGDYQFGGALDINDSGVIVGYLHNGNVGTSDMAVWYPSSADNEPPVISWESNIQSLWPPNHKMKLAVSGIQATDNEDQNPQLDITVTSNEPTNGNGDGNTDVDWEINENPDGTYDVYVRAERSGKKSGRLYTIEVIATDEAGNTSSETFTVSVGKSR